MGGLSAKATMTVSRGGVTALRALAEQVQAEQRLGLPPQASKKHIQGTPCTAVHSNRLFQVGGPKPKLHDIALRVLAEQVQAERRLPSQVSKKRIRKHTPNRLFQVGGPKPKLRVAAMRVLAKNKLKDLLQAQAGQRLPTQAASKKHIRKRGAKPKLTGAKRRKP